MNIKNIDIKPFPDQKPGTSGLRKKVAVFQQPHYLATFVQSILNTLTPAEKSKLVIGGDGRFFNPDALQIICKVAIANNVKELIIGQHGLLSTPAASCIIRKYNANGGFILSASHNPGGPLGDFGLKFNTANGGPAPESFTQNVYENTLKINQYFIADIGDIDCSTIGNQPIKNTTINVIDPVSDYANLMETLFDFSTIREHLTNKSISILFDAMHAITGPYAREIFVNRLGAPESALMNAEPKADFGGEHPDPNMAHAEKLTKQLFNKDGPDLGAASDGDGDRNMILGREFYVTPSDSLAIIAANAHLIPGYKLGLAGVARSMPTSRAIDVVAKQLKIPCYETPTGWKYFGNLLDAKKITLCGEESFGTGSNHIREKDGLWAVLCWLNILTVRNQSVKQITLEHWKAYGRHYYSRHDYENISSESANNLVNQLETTLPTLAGKTFGGMIVKHADNFSYTDPIDNATSSNQGIRILFEDGSRVIFRLSGTGTEGATLRVYLEKYTTDDCFLELSSNEALAPLSLIARDIAQILYFTDRTCPTVIT